MNEDRKSLYKKRLLDICELGFKPVVKITAVLGCLIGVYVITISSYDLETIALAVLLGFALFLMFTYVLGSFWWLYNISGFREHDRRKREQAERDSEDPWMNSDLINRPWLDFRSEREIKMDYYVDNSPSPLNIALAAAFGPTICFFVLAYNLIMYLLSSISGQKK